jgi:hypothetical protein
MAMKEKAAPSVVSATLPTAGASSPRKPKAMLGQDEDKGVYDITTRSLITFTLKLLLYSLLNSYRDILQDRHSVTAGDVEAGRKSTTELRRSFLDSVSYLCDNTKHGGTVTAAALRRDGNHQMISHSSTLYLAANEGIQPPVQRFARYLPYALGNVNSKNFEQIEGNVLDGAIALATERIAFYKWRLTVFVDRCLTDLKPQATGDNNGVF